jgi:hypothetical protein
MSWRPHEESSKECEDLHSIGQTNDSHRDVILPSRLSLATAIKSGFTPWTQSIIGVSPQARRYILIVAEIHRSPRVFSSHIHRSLTVTWNMLSRPGSLHLQICIVYSSSFPQNVHFGDCLPLLQLYNCSLFPQNSDNALLTIPCNFWGILPLHYRVHPTTPDENLLSVLCPFLRTVTVLFGIPSLSPRIVKVMNIPCSLIA